MFPRRIGSDYAALSRWDRESNTVAALDLHGSLGGLDNRAGPEASVGDRPDRQLRAPLETSAGWLVLTHGVGPMRGYRIGALLLDLDDPRKVLASLEEPLLTPPRRAQRIRPERRVLLRGLLHGDTLVLPYGCSDAAIRVALAGPARRCSTRIRADV